MASGAALRLFGLDLVTGWGGKRPRLWNGGQRRAKRQQSDRGRTSLPELTSLREFLTS
jgi:hypothetical protein